MFFAPAPDRQSLLRLIAWMSPGFPTGAYAYSHGLEWAVEAGDVCDAETLRAWLAALVEHGSGRNDLILMRQAHRCASDPAMLAETAEFAAATAPSRERHAEALDIGRAFVAAAAAWCRAPLPDPAPFAVAAGAIASAGGIAEDDAAAAYLQAFVANLVSAAVRLVPLGQSTGLRVLAAMEPMILQIAAATRDLGLDDIGGCAFRADLASMRHETQYARLFRA